MQPAIYSTARTHLALVAGCLLLAAYLPVWHKPWFVAESGHFGGGISTELLLLLALFKRWRPALPLTYCWLALALLGHGYIIFCNSSSGGPLLGFFLTGSLYLAAGLILYRSTSIQQYLSH